MNGFGDQVDMLDPSEGLKDKPHVIDGLTPNKRRITVANFMKLMEIPFELGSATIQDGEIIYGDYNHFLHINIYIGGRWRDIAMMDYEDYVIESRLCITLEEAEKLEMNFDPDEYEFQNWSSNEDFFEMVSKLQSMYVGG